MHLDEPGRWADLVEEDARFNADHCVIGYLVGKYWKLPDFICDAIRYHHEIDRIENHAARTMVAILQLAIHIYYQDQRMNNPEWSAVRQEVLDELGLGEESLPELIDVILDRYHGS
jgi:HD-like signal output (HDOD) protein